MCISYGIRSMSWSSHENFMTWKHFRTIGLFVRESTRQPSSQKPVMQSSWVFSLQLEQAIQQIFELPVIRHAMAARWRHCYQFFRSTFRRNQYPMGAYYGVRDMDSLWIYSCDFQEKQVRYGKIISYPLFADADTGIYPHTASQYHARPKAKRGIAMLSVDKFPYPRKQTRGNEFIPCSNNICDILKRFRSFKIPAITLIWPKTSYKHSVTRSYRSGKESGRRSESPLWRHQWRSFVFISHADDVKREIRLHISRLLTNQKRESARSMG